MRLSLSPLIRDILQNIDNLISNGVQARKAKIYVEVLTGKNFQLYFQNHLA